MVTFYRLLRIFFTGAILPGLIAALLLSACAPAAVPPVPTTTATPQQSKNLEVTPMATYATGEDLPLIIYSRSGGIVGFCDKVTIFSGGLAQVTSCHKAATAQITLSSDQIAKIASWQANLAGFKYDEGDESVPDGMTIHLVFSGNGKRSASSADQEAMMNLASDIAQAAGKQR